MRIHLTRTIHLWLLLALAACGSATTAPASQRPTDAPSPATTVIPDNAITVQPAPTAAPTAAVTDTAAPTAAVTASAALASPTVSPSPTLRPPPADEVTGTMTAIARAYAAITTTPGGSGTTDVDPPHWAFEQPQNKYQRPEITGHTATTVSLVWEPATDNVGVVGYEISLGGAYGPTEGAAPIAVTASTAYTFTNLVSFTVYHFYLRAVDAAGNRSIALDAGVVRMLDDQPPSPPTNIRVTHNSSTQLILAWDAAQDNGEVAIYELYIDGQLYEKGPDHEWVYVENLEPLKTYRVSIIAIDSDGNRSPPSPEIEVSTVDTDPPEFVGEIRVVAQTSTSVTFAWDPATDNVGVTEYRIYDDVGPRRVLLGATRDTTYTISGLSPQDVLLTVFIFVYDAAGNESPEYASGHTTVVLNP
ncbi:fibronectin type III domain-containing protein [Chloroflexales bacterium ZM16-3]|nr:fibronectin type III domain-containing protein [Chloroflexales bacterium ZM16-3]